LVFAVNNERQAKNIILTPEGGTTTDGRWEKETEFLQQDIGEFLNPTEQMLILDYGCGIGRLAKELINNHACRVLGVDISASMRQLATAYVKDERFSVVSFTMFTAMVSNGLRVDAGYSLWVLQHCPQVASDVSLIRTAVKQGGAFYVLNNDRSAVPTNKGWVNDGTNLKSLLEKEFLLQDYSKLPVESSSEALAANTFIGRFTSR
jgi:SAM-dependent methyltransferase